MTIQITTDSEIKDRKIKKVLERQEVSCNALPDAEAKLIKKVFALSKKVEWIVDVKIYQRPNGKFLMSGTPIILED